MTESTVARRSKVVFRLAAAVAASLLVAGCGTRLNDSQIEAAAGVGGAAGGGGGGVAAGAAAPGTVSGAPIDTGAGQASAGVATAAGGTAAATPAAGTAASP